MISANFAGFAFAQNGPAGPGDAVVTNFSGITQLPPPVGDAAINPNGPSALVLRLQGASPAGDNTVNPQIVKVLTAQQVGQVFPIGFSGQGPVYLGATSAFGLQIVKRDPSTGAVTRLSKGGPGAEWMDGQWGPEGGPGSLWRFDLNSGSVSLFATLPDNGPAGVGGVAVDPRSGHIYASDLNSGLIYHIDPSGAVVEAFDHGEQGRPAAGEAPVKDNSSRASIQGAAFDTLNPASWGFTAPERQVWGMGVFEGRLFYAVAGPSIWSVSLGVDGKFGGDPRKEIEVQSDFQARMTSLAFDERGALYAAQRGAIAPAPDFSSFAKDGSAQVLRFVRDDGTGQWRNVPQSYPIGRTPDFNHAAGGVALGCPSNGQPAPGVVNRQLWSTIDGVLPMQNPNLRHGLQGNATPMVRPAFMDTSTATFAVYDREGQEAPGFMGDVKILPCAAQGQMTQFLPPIPAPPPSVPVCEGPGCEPPPPLLGCPPDTLLLRDGFCCPRELVQRNGTCLPRRCPPETVLVRPGTCCPVEFIQPDGTCQPRRCPPNSVLLRDGDCCPAAFVQPNGTCRPDRCPPPFVKAPNGTCCPAGSRILPNGRCCPPGAFCPERCPPPLVGNFPDCHCPNGERLIDGRCRPPIGCIPPLVGTPGNCHCPGLEVLIDGRCVLPPVQCRPPLVGTPPNCHCPIGERLIDGRCIRIPVGCIPPLVGTPGNCHCPGREVLINGQCVLPPVQCQPPLVGTPPNCHCPIGERLFDGRCIRIPVGCIPPLVGTPGNCHCPNGEVLNGGRCTIPLPRLCPPPLVGTPPNCRCPNGAVPVFGRCARRNCPPGEILVNNICVPVRQSCPVGTVGVYPTCKPLGLRSCPNGTVGHPPFCHPLRRTPDAPGPVLRPRGAGRGFEPHPIERFRPWIRMSGLMGGRR